MKEYTNLTFSVVTYGEKGSVCLTNDTPEKIMTPAWIPTGKSVIDTTGAGDAFNAGVVLGFSEKWPMRDTLEFAAMIAGYNVCGLGPRGGLPTTETKLPTFAELKEKLKV